MTPRAAQGLYVLAREPELSRMLSWPPHEGVEDSLEFIHDARELWARRAAWLAGVFDVATGQLVGCIGLSGIDRANERAEVGTWIGLPFQRGGINRYAKAGVVAVGFEVLGLRRLEFLVRVDNEASLRAMRGLPGVREEGVLAERIVQRGEAHDAVAFALLRSEYDSAAWPRVTVDVG